MRAPPRKRAVGPEGHAVCPRCRGAGRAGGERVEWGRRQAARRREEWAAPAGGSTVVRGRPRPRPRVAPWGGGVLCRPGRASVLGGRGLFCGCGLEPNSQWPLGWRQRALLRTLPAAAPPAPHQGHTLRRPWGAPHVCQWLCLALAHLLLGHRTLGPPGATPRGCPARAAVPASCQGRLTPWLPARPPGLCASFPVSSPGQGGVPWSRTPPAPSVSLLASPGGPCPGRRQVWFCGSARDGEARDLTHSRRQEPQGRLHGGGTKLTLQQELDLLSPADLQRDPAGRVLGRARRFALGLAWGAQPNSANCLRQGKGEADDNPEAELRAAPPSAALSLSLISLFSLP